MDRVDETLKERKIAIFKKKRYKAAYRCDKKDSLQGQNMKL